MMNCRVIYVKKCTSSIKDPMWYRWLAHLTLTQETGVRVPAWELFAPVLLFCDA